MINARLMAPIERLVHWCERRPVASLMAVAIIATLAGITVALVVIEETRAERADFDGQSSCGQ